MTIVPLLCRYDVVWDWKKAAEKGVLDFVEKNVPPNKKEKALQRIHDSDYSPGSNSKGRLRAAFFFSVVRSSTPKN